MQTVKILIFLGHLIMVSTVCLGPFYETLGRNEALNDLSEYSNIETLDVLFAIKKTFFLFKSFCF